MSITSIINTSGAVVERYHYSAFGQRLVTAPDGTVRTDSTVDWKLGFHVEFGDVNATGKVDSGLTNYGYRYCSFVCGRWLGRDALSGLTNLNLHGLINNSPTNWFDLLGLADAPILDWYKSFNDKHQSAIAI